jgi:hypothetical protein
VTTIRRNRVPQPTPTVPHRPDPRDVPRRTVLVARPVAAEEPEIEEDAATGPDQDGPDPRR